MRNLTIQGGYHKYKEIAFLRGFAISTVVLMHLIQVYWNDGDIPMWLRTAATLGGTGGHVFIFCSGFGLYLSWLHRPIGFGEFMKKRFLKVYIPYLFFVVIRALMPHWGVTDAEHFRMFLSHVFLYKMFIERYMCSYGLQLWFISTILQLYLLFLPLCRLREKSSMKAMVLGSLGVSAAWWVTMYLTGLDAWRIWGSFCLQYLWEFVLGMAAAEYLYSRDSVHIPVRTLLLAAVGGLALQALMAKQGGLFAACNDVPGLIGYSAAALLLYRVGKYVIRPIFLWVDTFSYEWFLTHVLTIMWAYYYIWLYFSFIGHSTKTELIRALVAMTFSIGVAWVFALLMRLLVRLITGYPRSEGGNPEQGQKA